MRASQNGPCRSGMWTMTFKEVPQEVSVEVDFMSLWGTVWPENISIEGIYITYLSMDSEYYHTRASYQMLRLFIPAYVQLRTSNRLRRTSAGIKSHNTRSAGQGAWNVTIRMKNNTAFGDNSFLWSLESSECSRCTHTWTHHRQLKVPESPTSNRVTPPLTLTNLMHVKYSTSHLLETIDSAPSVFFWWIFVR